MKSVMLYFGSFNPVHKGHVAVAEWVLEQDICDEVWLVVSPHNPLKRQSGLIGEEHRLAMVRLAIDESRYRDRMRACDVEFDLPRPSYTADTLRVLGERYPHVKFSVLVGSDIVGEIIRWKEWDRLLSDYEFYVYPRRGYTCSGCDPRFIMIAGAPFEDYSSTDVRRALRSGEAGEMIPDSVRNYIKDNLADWMP